MVSSVFVELQEEIASYMRDEIEIKFWNWWGCH